MSSFAKVAVAAVALVAVGTVGVIALRPAEPGSVGSAATPTQTAAPMPSPASTGTPASSATVASSPAPPLTGSFSSSINGISFSYPAGWSTRPATEPWTTGSLPLFAHPDVDILHDPVLGDHLFVGVASQALAGTPGDQWAADFLADDGCGPTEPVTIDGAAGLLSEGQCIIAAVTSGGRGYFVWLHRSGDDQWLDQVYDRPWFEQVLATVDLRPDDAVDAAP